MIELRRDEFGDLDEIVTTDAKVHIEDMGSTLCLIITDPDRRVAIDLYADSPGRGIVRWLLDHVPLPLAIDDWIANRVRVRGFVVEDSRR